MICITSGCAVGFGAGDVSKISTGSDMSRTSMGNLRLMVRIRSHRSGCRRPILARRLFQCVAQEASRNPVLRMRIVVFNVAS